MKANIIKKIVFLIFLLSMVCPSVFAVGENSEQLKQAIDEKSKELTEVNDKINQVQKDLQDIQGQKQTLQQEVKKSDYTINQVNLGIKSSELNIQKLGLEIQSLKYNINDAESQIELKKGAIAGLLNELNRKDGESALVVFLRYKNLSESLNEVQNIVDLNSGLSNNVSELIVLNEKLSDNLSQSLTKKNAIKLENNNLKYRKVIVAEEKQNKQKLLTETKNQEKNYQILAADLENQQMAIAAEIDQLDKELRKKIDPSFLPMPRSGVLGYPVISATITQKYGFTDFTKKYYSGSLKGKYHNGLDFGKYLGAEILAAEDGIIVSVGDQDSYCYRGAYGKFIVIKHNNGLTTLYGHLSKQIVTVGIEVRRGQLIGYMGKTGWATGPHLHFTVYASSTFLIKQSKSCGPMPIGGDIDPIKYL